MQQIHYVRRKLGLLEQPLETGKAEIIRLFLNTVAKHYQSSKFQLHSFNSEWPGNQQTRRDQEGERGEATTFFLKQSKKRRNVREEVIEEQAK